jgi:prepilin peptidase CpaA
MSSKKAQTTRLRTSRHVEHQMISVAALLVFLGIATVTDLREQKIYNWTTYTGVVTALLLNTAGFGMFGSGLDGLQESLAGLLTCGLIMLMCFVLFNMGGGDVKLIAMMGAFLGLRSGIEALLWTCVLGGIAGVVILVWQIGFLRIVSKTLRHLVLILRAKSWIPLTTDERQPLKRGLFLAPSALVAACIVLKEHVPI